MHQLLQGVLWHPNDLVFVIVEAWIFLPRFEVEAWRNRGNHRIEHVIMHPQENSEEVSLRRTALLAGELEEGAIPDLQDDILDAFPNWGMRVRTFCSTFCTWADLQLRDELHHFPQRTCNDSGPLNFDLRPVQKEFDSNRSGNRFFRSWRVRSSSNAFVMRPPKITMCSCVPAY